jgi:phosphate ABC transporter phosphate-binding protein
VIAVTAAVLSVTVASFLMPARPAFAATYTTINGAGSSWAYPAINTWIGDVAPAGLTINYNPAGDTAGRQEFKQGQADFAASEIPYGLQDGASTDPPPTRGYAYVPDVAGGLAFMYNLVIGGRRVTNLRLSGAAIAGIFTGQVTQWNDPAIAADNPGLALPATMITPVVHTDGSGDTAEFTQWMIATEGPYWTSYCQKVAFSPCTQTSTYPVLPNSQMIGQPRDAGVAAYIASSQADGAIGYVQYSYAIGYQFPAAKVLNAAGYYTLPTAGNVAVSLLAAQVNNNPSDPLYLTADLSQVYTDPDPRTYELSAYSYLIVPTALDAGYGFSTGKGFSLAAFGQFALCQGQTQVDSIGYSAVPYNLVFDGYSQLATIPGSALSVPASADLLAEQCSNPTYKPGRVNFLADADPMPDACDQQGTAQCPPATTGAILTTTTVTASPSPAAAGQPVTLTATVASESGGAPPPGTVQFEVGGTDLGAPVATDSSGVATFTTAFTPAGTQLLTAVFTPADTTTFGSSDGTVSLPVLSILTMPLTTTIAPAGSFSVTVTTAGTVTMTVTGGTAMATLIPVVVSDTRNTYPGWSVTGAAIDFTGSGTAAGATISGSQLGWTPTATSLAPGVVLGGTVAPGGPGLGTAADLAVAGAGGGVGTSTLSADLTLAIPPSAAAGPYASVLTLTAVSAAP